MSRCEECKENGIGLSCVDIGFGARALYFLDAFERIELQSVGECSYNPKRSVKELMDPIPSQTKQSPKQIPQLVPNF